MRLQGLVRLAGYRHWPRSQFGRGVGVRFEEIAAESLKHERSLVVFTEPGELRRQNMFEEEAWLVHGWDERFLGKVLGDVLKKELELDLIAPSGGAGLWLSVRHGALPERLLPFDERTLDLKGMKTTSGSQAIDAGLA